MLQKIQHARSGGVLHGARPGWLNGGYLYSDSGILVYAVLLLLKMWLKWCSQTSVLCVQ